MTISFPSGVSASSARGRIDRDDAVRVLLIASPGVSAGDGEPAMLSQVACAF